MKHCKSTMVMKHHEPKSRPRGSTDGLPSKATPEHRTQATTIEAAKQHLGDSEQ